MPTHFRVTMVGGMQLEVDDHEVAIVRATAQASLKGEATPLISIMIRDADGATTEGPTINVLQVVSIEPID